MRQNDDRVSVSLWLFSQQGVCAIYQPNIAGFVVGIGISVFERHSCGPTGVKTKFPESGPASTSFLFTRITDTVHRRLNVEDQASLVKIAQILYLVKISTKLNLVLLAH